MINAAKSVGEREFMDKENPMEGWDKLDLNASRPPIDGVWFLFEPAEPPTPRSRNLGRIGAADVGVLRGAGTLGRVKPFSLSRPLAAMKRDDAEIGSVAIAEDLRCKA